MGKISRPTSKPDRTGGTSADDSKQVQPRGGNAVPVEYGGPRGKEPTRYGDWEKNGRCIDF